MALVFPVPFNTQLVTDQDLGRGFSIDENGQNVKKNQIYLCDKNNIVESFTTTDSSSLTLIRDQDSLKEALNVGGEISLSYCLISGKIMGNYIDNSSSGSDKLSFLYTRRIISKVIQLDFNAKPAPGIENIKDIEVLRSHYGQYYISKIEYGAMLDLKITLQSEDESTMKQIKGELSGSVTFSALSLSVNGHLDIDKSKTKNKLNVTSDVYMAGCQQLGRADVKSMEDAQRLMDEFKVDPKSLVPIRIEISPLPPTLTPLLTLDPLSLRNYRAKLTQIGKNYWEFEQLSIQLTMFSKMIEPITEDEDLSQYVEKLSIKVSEILDKVKNAQDETVKFMQDTFSNILNKQIPYSDADITEIKHTAGRSIGSIFTRTDQGNWFGPTVDGIPTFRGSYKYLNGNVYKGYCLNGKRHGKGIMTYPNGNIDQLLNIDGVWKDDEVSFPSIVKYSHKTIEIQTAIQCISWKEDNKSNPVAEHVEMVNLTTSDEFIYKYRVDIDMVNDQKFKLFFDQLRRSIDPNITKYSYLFMGMTGSGKTTLIEYFLNILTGQIQIPKVLRAQELEMGGSAKSITQQVCRYEIEYILQKTFIFSIILIDTPGYISSSSMEQDNQLTTSIIQSVQKIKLNGLIFVTGESLTPTSPELRIISSIYSTLPQEAFDCISLAITGCDSSDKSQEVRKIINERLGGIFEKPLLYIDNPWSQYIALNNNDLVSDSNLIISGNAEEIQKKLEDNVDNINTFFLERVRSKLTFKSNKFVNVDELIEQFKAISLNIKTNITNLSASNEVTMKFKNETIQTQWKKMKTITIEQYCQESGYAFINGKAVMKSGSNNPFPSGHSSTVCTSSKCLILVCHQDCQESSNPDKIKCTAFKDKDKNFQKKCQVCQCSYKSHTQAKFQFEWQEKVDFIASYNEVKDSCIYFEAEFNKNMLKENILFEDFKKYNSELIHLVMKTKTLDSIDKLMSLIESTEKSFVTEYENALKESNTFKIDLLNQIFDSLGVISK